MVSDLQTRIYLAAITGLASRGNSSDYIADQAVRITAAAISKLRSGRHCANCKHWIHFDEEIGDVHQCSKDTEGGINLATLPSPAITCPFYGNSSDV